MKVLPLLLASLVLAAAVPGAAASGYQPCRTQNTLATVAGHRVTLGLDANPCAAVEVQRPGGCLDVLWGVNLGVVVVGGSDTCQVLVKADAGGCAWCADLIGVAA